MKELAKRRTCNLAECTKINFIRITQANIQILPAFVRHISVLLLASCRLSSLKCSLGIRIQHYLFFVLFVRAIGSRRVHSNVFPRLSQESALCAKSPGVQHTPTDDPDTIPETVSLPAPFPCCTAVWNWIMGLSLIC